MHHHLRTHRLCKTYDPPLACRRCTDARCVMAGVTHKSIIEVELSRAAANLGALAADLAASHHHGPQHLRPIKRRVPADKPRGRGARGGRSVARVGSKRGAAQRDALRCRRLCRTTHKDFFSNLWPRWRSWHNAQLARAAKEAEVAARRHRRAVDQLGVGVALEASFASALGALSNGDFELRKARELKLLCLLLLVLVLPAELLRVFVVLGGNDDEEEIEREPRPQDNKHDEVHPRPPRERILQGIHNVGPPLLSHSLEDAGNSPADVIKCDGIAPQARAQRQAAGAAGPGPGGPAGRHASAQVLATKAGVQVEAAAAQDAGEQLHAKNAEDKKDEEADLQDAGELGDALEDEGHDELELWELGHRAQRAHHAQGAQGREVVALLVGRHKVKHAENDDEEVKVVEGL